MSDKADKGPTQGERLLALLQDGRPHSTPEILEVVYGGSHLGIARISARVYDLNRKLPFGQRIESTRDPVKKTVWIYQLRTVAEHGMAFPPAGELFA